MCRALERRLASLDLNYPAYGSVQSPLPFTELFNGQGVATNGRYDFQKQPSTPIPNTNKSIIECTQSNTTHIPPGLGMYAVIALKTTIL